jgi:DNA processing protein
VAQKDSGLRDAGVDEATRDAILHPDEQALAAELRWLQQDACSIVHRKSPDFPKLLREIPDPPTLLYVRGNIDALHLPCLAIVGSRNPTSGGIRNAQAFSDHLARTGFCIVSGLAQGIDTAAHAGALDAEAVTVGKR